jgi:hypothetical protein
LTAYRFSASTSSRTKPSGPLDSRSSESTPDPADTRIRCTTYNVNDKLPPPDTLELAPLVGNGQEDVLVFGFQEVGT